MAKYKNLSLNQVQRVAITLAEQLQKRGAVIGLIGQLGSGKTTFVKAFAKKFKISQIKSPTFVITHQYKINNRFLYHLDFYRLHHEKQLEPLGLGEILDAKNIVLLEWVDKFPKIRKRCDILITLKVKPDNKRNVEIRAQ